MTTLTNRLRGIAPTAQIRRDILLWLAHDEELTDTQIDALWIEYGFGVALMQDFRDQFAELRTLVERHGDLERGDETVAAEYGLPADAALTVCENDVFAVLDRLVPSLRAVS